MKFLRGDKVKVVKIIDNAPYEDALEKTGNILHYNTNSNMYFVVFDSGFDVPELAGVRGRFEKEMVFFEEELEKINE